MQGLVKGTDLVILMGTDSRAPLERVNVHPESKRGCLPWEFPWARGGIRHLRGGDGGGGSDFRTLAGAGVDGKTLADAREMGIDLQGELKNHNSTPGLEKLRTGIYTGNTGIGGET